MSILKLQPNPLISNLSKTKSTILQVAINPVGEKIIEAFMPDCKRDEDGKPVKNTRISFSQFVKTFAVFRPIRQQEEQDSNVVNSRDSKVRFLFNLIDSAQVGSLTRESIYEMLEMMVGAQVK